MPRLWTRARLILISVLSAIGALQAVAAIVAAMAASRLLGAPAEGGMASATAVLAGVAGLIALRVVQRRWAERFALGYVKALRLALMSHVMRLPANGRSASTGLVMTRVVNDLSAIKLWLSDGVVSIAVAASLIGSLLTFLVIAHPGLAAALLPGLLAWGAVLAVFAGPLNRRIVQSRRVRGRIANAAGRILAGRLTLLAHGRHGTSLRKLERQSDDLNRELVGRATVSGVLRAASELVFPITAVCFGLQLFGGGATSLELLGLLILVTAVLVGQLNAVAIALEYRLANNVAMARLRNVFTRPALEQADEVRPLRRKRGGRALAVSDFFLTGTSSTLSFSVPKGGIAVLRDLPEDVARGLFAQLAGIDYISAGHVTIDDVPLERFDPADLRKTVAYLTGAMPMVPASLAVNASLGSPRAVTSAARAQVLQTLGLTEDVLSVRPDDAVRVSKRTLAAVRAARTMLRKASVVLVDDADVMADPDLLCPLLHELQARRITIVLAPGVVEIRGSLPTDLRADIVWIETQDAAAA
ncbi:ABC transporter transmembrane domain-containing protein [Bauldia sp.]|uniref:ABC transporter transmembrane domain-containing protein n=1 Tax=Bauldia sp. TaxID=2575872 RepID=UPI003BAACF34